MSFLSAWCIATAARIANPDVEKQPAYAKNGLSFWLFGDAPNGPSLAMNH